MPHDRTTTEMPPLKSKGVYIQDIKGNAQAEGVFLVKDKNPGITKNGKPYLALTLCDKTGDVKGRVWDNAENLGKRFQQGDIVWLSSFSVVYQGSLQLNVRDIQPYPDIDAVLPELLSASDNDPDEIFTEFMQYAETLENTDLKELLETIFLNPEIQDAFKTAPAAKSIHHDYLGGLLEHTLQVTRLSDEISKHYPHINRDILIAGSMLHDIGKIHELSYKRHFEYTDNGRLIGHISLGVEIINNALSHLSDFPEELAAVIKHLVLSHHGQHEFGSPKRPKTLEAFLLSYVDDMDAKLYCVAHYIKKEKSPDTKWTSYHKLFDRYLYTETFSDDETETDNSSSEKP